MIHSYLETLQNLWQRIESLNSDLPDFFLDDIERTILNFDLKIFSFYKDVPEFLRLTINRTLPNGKNERLSDVKWLYPRDPATVNEYGRMNLKKETIFYGSSILPTLINEVKPKIGDVVTLSEWSIKDPKTKLLVFPSFKADKIDYDFLSAQSLFFEKLKSYPPAEQSIILVQQNLLANIFSKKIGIKSNYVFSASIANNILSKVYDGQIEAIIYPSVQDPAKVSNIAIKPKVFLEKFYLSSIREYKIVGNNDDIKTQQITGVAKGIRDKIIKWE